MIERTARAAAPAALTLFVVIGAALSRQDPTIIVGAAIVTVAAAGAISWWWLSGWPLVVALLVPAAGLFVLCFSDSVNLGWFGMCVIAGWAALRAAVGPAVSLGVVLVAAFVSQALVIGGPGWEAWIAGTVFASTACVLTRRQRQLADRLRAAQAGLADRARTEERNRIATEMHDVIGHALTVCILHVSSARLALDDDPEEARDSLTAAEDLARDSLEEVRATVGLLRAEDPSTDGALPMPSGADVPALVESFRRAGSRVDLDIRGDPESLGTTRGLALYRIVQESLTNAVRHGDGSPVVVRMDLAPDNTTVTVSNGSSRRSGTAEGAGLVGMRERAEALGGWLSAGPVAGGWRTEAVIPS